MSAVIKLVTAVGGMLAVMVLWFGIQSFVRWRSGCGANKDVLDFMKNGCAGCKGDGACHNRGKEGEHEHHELA
jgi:hypothetical protein